MDVYLHINGTGYDVHLEDTVTPSGISTGQAFGTAVLVQSIEPSGIATSEAFGDLVFADSIELIGIATTEAFGTAVLVTSIELAGLATSEAFGTASITGQIILDGIATSEAFGDPIFADIIEPEGIATTEAFGTAIFSISIELAGIATSEAFGTHQIDIFLNGAGITSSEAFGTALITQIIAASGISSQQAFGGQIVSGPILLDGLGIPSLQAFGTSVLTTVIAANGIGSLEDFGTLVFEHGILLAGIISRQAFGQALVFTEQYVTLDTEHDGIPSQEQFGRLQFDLDGGRIVGPAHGSIKGGQPITLLAAGIDMSTAGDTFSDGVIDTTKWTVTTAGSGYVHEIPVGAFGTSGILQFSSGRTVGSRALIRSADTAGIIRFDVSIDLTFPLLKFRNGISTAKAFLGAHIVTGVASGSRFTATVEITKAGPNLRITSSYAGSIFENVPITLTGNALTKITLRVLKVDERMFVFVNSVLIYQGIWTTDAATFEFGVENDAVTNGADIIAAVTKFVRSPVILFDTHPMLSVQARSPGRVDGLTPKMDRAGDVLINITTHINSFDVDNVYTYTQETAPEFTSRAGDSTLVTQVI